MFWHPHNTSGALFLSGREMPALQVFGRRWLLAEDDLPLPAAVLALFHLVSLLLLLLLLV